MSGTQLPLFQRKTFKGIVPSLPMEIQPPAADRTVLRVLPAYYLYLKDGGYSRYTPDDFTGDVRKFGMFVKEKQLKDIATEDIQAWISFLETPGPKGEGLSAKMVSRKLTALGNFFHWLITKVVTTEKANPMRDIANRRVSAPLPEILFEDECRKLLTAVSGNPRTYFLIFLFLETRIKLEELFSLKESHFDFSNKYGPEVHIKHSGKK